MDIQIPRRFKRLIPEVDDIRNELIANKERLCLVSIAEKISGKPYHDDGVYDFARVYPSSDGLSAQAQILKKAGETETIDFFYDEAGGLLVPEDDIVIPMEHPGSFRRIPSLVPTKRVLERMVGQVVLVNDYEPKDNRTYSTRVIESCGGNSYRARIMDGDKTVELKVIEFNYDHVAGILIPDAILPAEFKARRY